MRRDVGRIHQKRVGSSDSKCLDGVTRARAATSLKNTWCSMFAQLYRQVHMVSPKMVRCAQMLRRLNTRDQVKHVIEHIFRS